MKFNKLPIVAVTSALMAAPTLGITSDHDELELDEAQLYFELNDTDGDLGIHGKADGDAWKRMKIEGPNGRKHLDIRVRSKLRRQGLTELFFESAEPTFDELDPEVFFARFPEGVYEWEGKTLDGEEIEGEVPLSHIIPEAPVVVSVGGAEKNPGFYPEGHPDEGDKICWEDVETTANGGVIIEWEHVDDSHFDKWSDPENKPLLNEEKIPLGDPGEIGEIVYYEFVAEIDDTDYKSTAVIPAAEAEFNSWVIPADIIALAEEHEVKFEIIVRVESGIGYDDDDDPVPSKPGNQSAVEDCFEI